MRWVLNWTVSVFPGEVQGSSEQSMMLCCLHLDSSNLVIKACSCFSPGQELNCLIYWSSIAGVMVRLSSQLTCKAQNHLPFILSWYLGCQMNPLKEWHCVDCIAWMHKRSCFILNRTIGPARWLLPTETGSSSPAVLGEKSFTSTTAWFFLSWQSQGLNLGPSALKQRLLYCAKACTANGIYLWTDYKISKVHGKTAKAYRETYVVSLNFKKSTWNWIFLEKQDIATATHALITFRLDELAAMTCRGISFPSQSLFSLFSGKKNP